MTRTFTRLTLALCLLSIAACNGPRPIRPADSRPPPPAPAAAPRDAATTQALQRARTAVQETQAVIPGWSEANKALADAQTAAAQGNHLRAQSLADQATARAGFALDAHYLALAQLELQKAQVYTGLNEAQLEKVRKAELALAQGRGRIAHELLEPLLKQLAETTQRYVVAAGDSLWVISGKPEVYGNPWLWPLIWQANLNILRDPSRLLVGQKLKIRPNPTIEEVVKAVDYARRHAGREVRIGEVRTE